MFCYKYNTCLLFECFWTQICNLLKTVEYFMVSWSNNLNLRSTMSMFVNFIGPSKVFIGLFSIWYNVHCTSCILYFTWVFYNRLFHYLPLYAPILNLNVCKKLKWIFWSVYCKKLKTATWKTSYLSPFSYVWTRDQRLIVNRNWSHWSLIDQEIFQNTDQ